MQAILTDLSGESVLAREQFSTQGEDFLCVYDQVCQAVDRLLAQMPATRYGLVGMGVAVHGVVDLSGLIRFIPRRGWRNVDLRSLLEERYQVPVSLDNDGNLAALAQQELIGGMGELEQEPLQSLAMVNIGDSISVGLITNGEVFRGFHGFANAIGHHTINFDEPVQCSLREIRLLGAVLLRWRSDSLMPIPCCPQPISSIQELAALIRRQDPIAQAKCWTGLSLTWR